MSGDVDFTCGIWGYDPEDWREDYQNRIYSDKKNSRILQL